MKLVTLIFSLFVASSSAHAADGNVNDRKYVCMMQDALQVKPGTPIEHEGKTYYGVVQCVPRSWLKEVPFTLKLKRAGGASRRTLLATWRRHSLAGDMNHA